MMKKIQGFTLIELMVTIAVMAIIAMMAAPTFGDMLDKQNLNRSTQDLIATLKEARARAVLERKDVEVKLNADPKDNTTILLNWQTSGAAILKSTTTSLTFNLNGAVIKANGAVPTGSIDFTVCDKAGGSKSKSFALSTIGTIQQVTEGICA